MAARALGLILAAAVVASCAAVARPEATVSELCKADLSAPKQGRYKMMLAKAMSIEDEIIALRRELHRRPATMYEEYEAQELVMKTLGELGIESTKTAITGVRADLGAAASTSPTIVVLRADMDALPIHEEADLDFKSEVDGVMHACGHDTHTAVRRRG